jgi:hypothetical protein
MQLSELINENAVRLHLAAHDKESCIKELVQLLESAHGVNTKGEILSKVLQRESMMSTGIGNGVAIPHGKTRLLDHLVAACGTPSGRAPAPRHLWGCSGRPSRAIVSTPSSGPGLTDPPLLG